MRLGIVSVALSSRTSCISSVRHHLDSSRRTRTSSASDKQTVNIHQDQQFWQAYNKVSYDPFTKLRINAAFLWTPTARQGILPAFSGYANSSTSSAASVLANQNRGTFSPQSNYNADIRLDRDSHYAAFRCEARASGTITSLSAFSAKARWSGAILRQPNITAFARSE